MHGHLNVKYFIMSCLSIFYTHASSLGICWSDDMRKNTSTLVNTVCVIFATTVIF